MQPDPASNSHPPPGAWKLKGGPAPNQCVFKKVSLALLALVCLALAAEAYTDLSLLVQANLQRDGSVVVQEEFKVALNNQQELESFDYYTTLGEVPLTEWKRFSDRVGYHFNGPILKTRILATRDYTTGSSVGKIMVEYTVNTSIVKAEQVGARATRYTLTQEYFGFERARGGEALLPKGATLVIELPAEATLVKVLPEPMSRKENRLSWSGPLASAWNVQYDVEKPLTEEVSEYFRELYRSLLSPSQLPLTLLVLALAALAAFYLWGRRGKSLA